MRMRPGRGVCLIYRYGAAQEGCLGVVDTHLHELPGLYIGRDVAFQCEKREPVGKAPVFGESEVSGFFHYK